MQYETPRRPPDASDFVANQMLYAWILAQGYMATHGHSFELALSLALVTVHDIIPYLGLVKQQLPEGRV